MSVEEFQDRDDDYLKWVEAHRTTGHVVNVGRSGHGAAMVHLAACHTIASRPPFTGPYIKICSTALGDLDQWALNQRGTVPERCRKCQPSEYIVRVAAPADSASPAPAFAGAEPTTMAGREWEIDEPDDRRRVRLWSNTYIPFEPLTDDQRAAREALRLRVRSLAAAPDEILHARYAGPRPANMDVENLVLYNIDGTAGGCFQPGTRHGVRFEMAEALHSDPPSGRRYAHSYQYGLTSPGSSLSHWRRVRPLASFSAADLGDFKSAKRLEQVWFAIHDVTVATVGARMAPTERFAVFLTLSHPSTKSGGANPELVKALVDGTVAAFQSHSDFASVDEIAARLAPITGQPASRIKQALLDDSRAVLGADTLVYLRGTGVQWNPADHLCVAGQVQMVGQHVPGTTWTLSGEIHAVEQVRQGGCGS